ncbi:hypothetical protein ACWNX4_00700 [Candidatus Vidania fulgoroideorum]
MQKILLSNFFSKKYYSRLGCFSTICFIGSSRLNKSIVKRCFMCIFLIKVLKINSLKRNKKKLFILRLGEKI